MELPILIYGNKILEQPGQTIDKEYPDLQELINNMFETMAAASGIGLAAHQIGIPIRLFIVDIRQYNKEDEKYKEFKKVFINSEIVEVEEEETSVEEGCLSIPGVKFTITRATKVKLKYFDEIFIEHEEWFDDIAARCIQHEHDHTQGILFTKKASAFSRTLNQSKLKNIVKGKFLANYKYKL